MSFQALLPALDTHFVFTSASMGWEAAKTYLCELTCSASYNCTAVPEAGPHLGLKLLQASTRLCEGSGRVLGLSPPPTAVAEQWLKAAPSSMSKLLQKGGDQLPCHTNHAIGLGAGLQELITPPPAPASVLKQCPNAASLMGS